MGAATVATLVVVAILVLVLALFVFIIGLGLRRLSFTLGTIIVGLRAIREQTRPVGPVLTSVLNDVTTIDDNLGGLLTAVGEAVKAPPARAGMRGAVAQARQRISAR